MNKVVIEGVVESKPQIDHEYRGRVYFKSYINVKRRSGAVDTLPIITIESELPETVRVVGRIRSYNRQDPDKNRLIIYIQADEIEESLEDDTNGGTNEVEVEGYIVNPPIYRETPFGKEICDIMIGVNRPSGKTDYIPCIAWGKLAKIISQMRVGENIGVRGRMQSRQYSKKMGDIEEIRTAYELSIFYLK